VAMGFSVSTLTRLFATIVGAGYLEMLQGKRRVKQFLEARLSYGLTQAARQLHNEWIWFRRHRRACGKAGQFLHALPIKLNIGCGPNRKEGWVNVDILDSAADLQLDLRERWPFPENSVSYIYSEHSFEHFDLQFEVPHLLAEARRVLEPDGVFDVAVPDTEAPLRAYGDPNATYWSVASENRWHPHCQTQLERINYHFRQNGEHKYAWDAETLASAMRTAGFTEIARREFNSSLDTRPFSLWMVGKKPPNSEVE
jgi:predicted SAM-dependent methyltransferase